jgi:hypothetical protein
MSMDTKFYILLTMKTPTGPESFAKFFIGNNRAVAYDLFRKLKGSPEVDERNVLHLDFMETKDDLPLNLKLITCTLDELAENCKLITKEVFKISNLKEW